MRSAVGRWNRSIIAVQVVEHARPIVLQAWIHAPSSPRGGNLFVFDVTSGPVKDATRWLITKAEEDGTFTKIGSVQTYPSKVIEDEFEMIMLN